MKIKYLIVMLLLLIPFSFGNVYNYPLLEVYNPYSAYFNAYFVPSENVIPLDEPVSFAFYIYLDDTLEHGLLDTSFNVFSSVYDYGVPESVLNNQLRPQISYGLLDSSEISSTSITELPYYIKSCHIKCDASNVLYDHSYYPSNTDYSDSMQLIYDCQYSNEDLINNVTKYMSIYCEFETQEDYVLKGGSINMTDFFDNRNTYWGDITEYGFTCTENPIILGSSPLEFNDYGGKCISYFHQLWEVTPVNTDEENFDYNGSSGSADLGNYSLIDPGTININENENEQEGAGGSGTPDKTQQGNDQKQKEKQKQYEQQLRIVEKKNDFLNNLVDICVVLFSIMLLTYYLIAIAVLGYLLATLFPKIISSPYTIIKSFRENRGDNK